MVDGDILVERVGDDAVVGDVLVPVDGDVLVELSGKDVECAVVVGGTLVVLNST